jgi:tetratricopeptide (TPR) repeat protein
MMLRWITFAVALLVCAATGARADERAANAQLRYESGMAHFNLQEWDAAIADWQEGYRIKPVPEFLFNIAQAYRKSDRPEKAIFFYQRYLSLAPDAASRDEVERYIATARAQLAAHPPAPKVAEPKPAVPTAPTVPTEVRPAPPTNVPSPTANVLTSTAPARTKPVYKKAWFWGTVGTVAVVAAGGVVLGVMLAGDHHKTLDPVTF